MIGARSLSGRQASRTIRVAALLAALALTACGQASTTPQAKQKPVVHLLTPLPLLWNETFGLDQPKSPVIAELEKRFTVKPVDLPSQLPDGGLLLAIQPRALPAEELVALDAWARRGGRLVLLADPMLEWPSQLPLGDARRAPASYADTGLLRHWGLRLDAPDERGPAQRQFGGKAVLTASPGALVKIGGECAVADGALAAECRIGRGSAVIIADADWLNVGTSQGLDGPTAENLDALTEQLLRASRD